MRLCIAQWGLGTCRGRQNPRRLPFTSRSACVLIPGQRSGAAWVMVQLRPRASRAPVSASAMVDEGQPASEEEAEHGLLLGQPSSGAAAEPLEEDEEGDDELDDEAPEELTFASAQAEAKEEERRVRETVRRDKTLLKEKRKRREELFIEQKCEEITRKVERSQNKSYLAVRLKDQDLRDSRQEAAKAFIQNCLYGPGTNRTTVNKFLSLDNKRLPVKKAAAQFLNNAWASQKKQNAKRFKRRWMVVKMKTSKK
ncbi:U3 small nucleolar RNA-associated protein NOL7 isoform X2 [Globicephala melas]|uniref:U3 small nucleolar RNA-associated protein NOL7 isoform X2 n=1 Tax=Globicephala melas TaxID=9731 RepID=UPI00293D2244|nr:nucleolar protein 7 isoform X2 [Globicephala melas]